MLDFCRLNTPVTVLPFAAVSESAGGKACSMGVKEPVGGGGVVEGGGGGVVEGGGGGGVVVEGGGGGGVVEGGGVVPAATTVVVIGIRKRVDTPAPDSPI